MIEVHEEVIHEIAEQFKMILESSDQAIYIYLDDIHKVSNAKYADLLGYSSPEEWQRVKNPVETTVAPQSQATLVAHYNQAMDKMSGSTFNVTWKKKNGGTVDTTVILVPIAFHDHLLALHFIS